MSSIRDERTQMRLLNRRFLFKDLLSLGAIEGRMELVEFLDLTWDLSSMPSTDYRFPTAAGDIRQHMVLNSDWDYDYLFGNYLNLLEGPEDQLFRFLENIVHPLVREPDQQPLYIEMINKHLIQEGFQLQLREEISGHKVYHIIKIGAGVAEQVKNLVFASNGPKPKIVLLDAVSNNIQITENEQFCLVYDQAIPTAGLLWSNLVAWWAEKSGEPVSLEVEQSLFRRLRASLSPNSPPERVLFNTYFQLFRQEYDSILPALIPQVYLHYDPYTLRGMKNKTLARQRMDFLLLFSNSERVVIEVDGKQHFADDHGLADPRRYAEMVAADRELRLAGYELYRFGAAELQANGASQIIERFFRKLFKRHRIQSVKSST